MFNHDKAMKLDLSDLKTNGVSPLTITSYSSILGYYATFCSSESLDPLSPAAVAGYKAQMSEKGNKLVTITMHLNILRLFFAFCIRMKLTENQAENPVLDELMPPRKKVRAERKPYDHLMGEEEIRALFTGGMHKGARKGLYLRNRAIVLTLVGCGLRNSELRSLTPRDLTFGDESEAKITVHSGKGDKYRIVPFPTIVQQAVLDYLSSNERPKGLKDTDILFGVGDTRDEWHPFARECLSDMCKRYIESCTGFEGARSHACRHAFASLNLTHGVPMAEIQSMLGHSSIMTTEHYAALLRPTAPTASGNKVFNNLFTTQEALV